MPNLRVLYGDVVRSATVSASSTAAGFSASNLKTDRKGQVHRSVGKYVTYYVTWSGSPVKAVALPATNLTPSATIQVLVRNSSGSLVFDSGASPACPGAKSGLLNWTGQRDANAFPRGLVSKSTVWLPSEVYGGTCEISVSDPNHPAGYIDCSRVLLAPYWEPTVNYSLGGTVQPVDTSSRQRMDSGAVAVSRGYVFERVRVPFDDMPGVDRSSLSALLSNIGVSEPILVSCAPGHPDPKLEHDQIVYGYLNEASIKTSYYNGFSSELEIEGW